MRIEPSSTSIVPATDVHVVCARCPARSARSSQEAADFGDDVVEPPAVDVDAVIGRLVERKPFGNQRAQAASPRRAAGAPRAGAASGRSIVAIDARRWIERPRSAISARLWAARPRRRPARPPQPARPRPARQRRALERSETQLHRRGRRWPRSLMPARVPRRAHRYRRNGRRSARAKRRPTVVLPERRGAPQRKTISVPARQAAATHERRGAISAMLSPPNFSSSASASTSASSDSPMTAAAGTAQVSDALDVRAGRFAGAQDRPNAAASSGSRSASSRPARRAVSPVRHAAVDAARRCCCA